jgi:hypothetical protein
MKRLLWRTVLSIDPKCSWCHGTGKWTDPNGQSWPCIKCN